MNIWSQADERKFGLLAAFMAGLVVAAIAYGLFLGTVVESAGAYLGRRWHYERAVVPKGLTLHEGTYWREKK